MKKHIIISLITIIVLFTISTGFLLYDGKIWFSYPEKMGYCVKGVDVARYQGDIDWEKISSQNIKFAFIKATEGSSYFDPTFNANIVSSKKNGIYAGAYHFFSGESSGKTQAENFIKIVSGYQLDLPPVLDFEISKKVKDKENIINEVNAFLKEIEEHFNVKPIIYTTYESYNAFLTDGFDEYPLWFRDLFKEPKIRANKDWLFWQYCNRGRLKGIDKKQKYVDLNVFKGTEQEFEEYVNEIASQMRQE